MDGSNITTEVFLVAVEDIPAVWPEIAHLLLPACSLTNDRVTLDSVKQSLMEGDKRLFLAVQAGKPIAAATVLVGEHDNGKWLYICQMGGRNPVEWLHTGVVLIQDFAKIHDCRGVLINNARAEWERVLDPLGFAKTGIRLEWSSGDAR
jgi:hypothetical protein